MRRVRSLDWDAVAVLIAALSGLVLHLLHLAKEELLLTIVMVALAGVLVRDLRREQREEEQKEALEHQVDALHRLERAVTAPEAVLVGPDELRTASEAFARSAAGDMIWFNVCLTMFRPQWLFDLMLKPAIENPKVRSIQFVLSERERERWRTELTPKIAACANREKVREPRWCALDESVSFIMSQSESNTREAQLSFWGEPFMSISTGAQVPRFVFHLPAKSALLPHLLEMDRKYRMAALG